MGEGVWRVERYGRRVVLQLAAKVQQIGLSRLRIRG